MIYYYLHNYPINTILYPASIKIEVMADKLFFINFVFNYRPSVSHQIACTSYFYLLFVTFVLIGELGFHNKLE